MKKPVLQLVEYEGHLAPFGDPYLDVLAATEEVPRVYTRQKSVLKEKCPSCGNVAFLRRGFYATLCEECHADIERLAWNTPW